MKFYRLPGNAVVIQLREAQDHEFWRIWLVRIGITGLFRRQRKRLYGRREIRESAGQPGQGREFDIGIVDCLPEPIKIPVIMNARGHTDAHIARVLNLSASTVRKRIEFAYQVQEIMRRNP